MRINARIATSSSRGVSRFPTIPDDECVDADGHLDEVRARQILNSEDLITWADDDDKSVMAFAMEFLRQLKNVVVWMNRQPDIDVKYDRAETKIEKRCARNLERGRYCFARVEIKHRRDRIEASVSWSNPMGIVGEGADKIPKDFALLCVNVLLCIGDEIKKRGGIEIAVIEGDNCAGYIAEAREINRQRDLELKMIKLVEKKAACKNRVGDYCSPSCPDCEWFKQGGMCKSEEEMKCSWL